MIVHPSETIKEHMNFLGLDSSDLEAKTGVDREAWDLLAGGWQMIDFEEALNLEKAFAPSAEFWLNLEYNYQMAKLEESKRITELSHEIKKLKKERVKAEEANLYSVRILERRVIMKTIDTIAGFLIAAVTVGMLLTILIILAGMVWLLKWLILALIAL